ncbi:MAG: fused MFS/spermidine synthase [Proteobacteria bacterium]|nr:fused MFS/spermidine synthase [Pseudomonadota bacterium]
MIARFILPWFGGGSAIWTTCMLFFQIGLLGGYLYAHLLATRLPLRKQVIVHLTALVAAFLFLPITPDQADVTRSGIDPATQILLLLAVHTGIPFLLISATAPLFQHWFANAQPGRSPFRLYALSNAGSLVALLSYPFLIEPNLRLIDQTLFWSFGFVLLAGVALWCTLPILTGRIQQTVYAGSERGAVTPGHKFVWVLFSACGSIALLAITNQMTQDIAVVPFLWVIPLGLYLLSFIICFDREAWYRRTIWVPFLLLTTGFLVYLLQQDLERGELFIGYQIAIYCAAGFACFMIFHGELARRKSQVSELTTFYLYVSFGGALGGLFVALIAPRIFNGYWELHAVLLAAFLSTIGSIWFDPGALTTQMKRAAFAASGVVCTAMLSYSLVDHIEDQQTGNLLDLRTFYGVLHVHEPAPGPNAGERNFFHGRIKHGTQVQGRGNALERLPTTYYSTSSGLGLAIRFHSKRSDDPSQPMNMAMVGLGIGTSAAHMRTGDRMRFYEINPAVEKIAREYFTFLDLYPDVDVVIGDARVSLTRELTETGSHQFDVLAVDAFSGDSIPVHLLTEEAMELYLAHLAPDGVLAFHTTNMHLDLAQLILNLADKQNLPAYLISDESSDRWTSSTDWVVITRNEYLTSRSGFTSRMNRLVATENRTYWTDNFGNLLDVLIWD